MVQIKFFGLLSSIRVCVCVYVIINHMSVNEGGKRSKRSKESETEYAFSECTTWCCNYNHNNYA